MANIYRRGKTWWGRVTVKGREVRQSLKTTARHVAQDRLRQWLTEQAAVSWGDKPTRTFDEAMESFLLNHLPTLKPKSQTRYRVSARQLVPHFDGLTLEQITSTKLAEYESARRKQGASSPTIRRDLFCLSSMFTHIIVDLEWLDLNPVPLFLKRQKRRGKLKESPPRTRYLDHAEERLLIAHASPELQNEIAFAIDTGLRFDEQYGLTWDRVDLAKKRLVIPKELSKSSKERVVYLQPRSAQILAQLPRRLRLAGGPDWVFGNGEGERLVTRQKGFKAAARRAGLKDLRWHDLRRTCGCRLLQDHGLSMEAVRDWLGHESIVTTEKTYAFLDPERAHKQVSLGTKAGTGAADSKRTKAKK